MKIIESFVFAFRGLKAAFQEEAHFRFHVFGLGCVIGLGICFNLAAWEWCAILLSSGLVISLELVNTAVENLTDCVTTDPDPIAGKVKDIAAAAVLVAAVFAISIGMMVFGRHIIQAW
jgi:undecaprenol kinase